MLFRMECCVPSTIIIKITFSKIFRRYILSLISTFPSFPFIRTSSVGCKTRLKAARAVEFGELRGIVNQANYSCQKAKYLDHEIYADSKIKYSFPTTYPARCRFTFQIFMSGGLEHVAFMSSTPPFPYWSQLIEIYTWLQGVLITLFIKFTPLIFCCLD